MTDAFAPGGPGSPDVPPSPPAAGAPEPAGGQAPDPAAAVPARQPGGRRAVLIIGAIVVFLVVVLFIVRNNVAADDLAVGECFDVPNGTSIQTVERHACTESHTAEVFHVAEYTGDGSTYPISLSLDRFIDEACVPAFEAYTGESLDTATELTIGYFYPSRDGWSSGDRTFTCYAALADESAMTESVKGPGVP
jgi:hypothetical protein